jgi:hypothetical protein
MANLLHGYLLHSFASLPCTHMLSQLIGDTFSCPTGTSQDGHPIDLHSAGSSCGSNISTNLLPLKLCPHILLLSLFSASHCNVEGAASGLAVYSSTHCCTFTPLMWKLCCEGRSSSSMHNFTYVACHS